MLSRVGYRRRATSQPSVSCNLSPNRTYTFRYVSGSPKTTALLKLLPLKTFLCMLRIRTITVLKSVSTDYSSGFKTLRSSASLRHVDGFPILRLLRRLRPAFIPSPVSTDSLHYRRSECGSHVPVLNPFGCLGACFTPDGTGERQKE